MLPINTMLINITFFCAFSFQKKKQDFVETEVMHYPINR